MIINRLIAILALFIFSSICSFCQNSIEIYVDSVQKKCIIFEINKVSKTFSQDIISDCKKAQIFDVEIGRIVARWDTIDGVNITLYSKHTFTKEPEAITVGVNNITEIISICNSSERKKITKNGATKTESVLNVEYIDQNKQKCFVQWDSQLLMALGKPVCK